MQKHVHEKGTVSIEKLIANIKDMPNFYKVGAIAIFVGLSAAKTIEERKFRSCARTAPKRTRINLRRSIKTLKEGFLRVKGLEFVSSNIFM